MGKLDVRLNIGWFTNCANETEYYPQFGFKEASAFGITDSEGYNYPAFMGMELIPKYLSAACGGKYYESDIYDDDLNRHKVKAFDDADKLISFVRSGKR